MSCIGDGDEQGVRSRGETPVLRLPFKHIMEELIKDKFNRHLSHRMRMNKTVIEHYRTLWPPQEDDLQLASQTIPSKRQRRGGEGRSIIYRELTQQLLHTFHMTFDHEVLLVRIHANSTHTFLGKCIALQECCETQLLAPYRFKTRFVADEDLGGRNVLQFSSCHCYMKCSLYLAWSFCSSLYHYFTIILASCICALTLYMDAMCTCMTGPLILLLAGD